MQRHRTLTTLTTATDKILSVIVPAYNAEQWVSKCMDSLISASTNDYEIIAINDGSCDNTQAILESYQNAHPKLIKAIAQENRGAGETRNYGISIARGKYISFVDCDDAVEPEYFDKMIKRAEETQCDILIEGYKRITKDGAEPYIPQQSEWSKYLIMAPWSKLFRSSFLRENNIKFTSLALGEDDYFSSVAYSYTDKIEFLDACDYLYLFNEQSMTNTEYQGMGTASQITQLLEQIDCDVACKDRFLYYHYIKLGIYYMLFSGKRASGGELLKENQKLFDWYKDHNVPLKFPIHGDTSSDSIKNRLAINAYLAIYKLHALSAFAKFYCKA